MLVHYSYKLAMAIDNIHNYRTLDDKHCEMQMRDVLDGLYDLACMTSLSSNICWHEIYINGERVATSAEIELPLRADCPAPDNIIQFG